jgi:hypothetical protein
LNAFGGDRYSLHGQSASDFARESFTMPLLANAVARLRTGRGALGDFALVAALLGATVLVALEPPSKPFLDKNSFYLTSSGFRVKVADDAAGMKVLRTLPAHRFVIHKTKGGLRYLYAEPKYCVCIFVGDQNAYRNYRDILSRPLAPVDNDVAPDYKTQASALLDGDPYDMNNLDQPDSIADYLRDYY